MRNWTTITDLAAALIAKGHAGKTARLTSETALIVGLKLMTADAKPSRDEIARILCDSKCDSPCYACRGRANMVVRAYGQGSERSATNPPSQD